MDLPAGGAALPPLKTISNTNPAAAGVVVRRSRARGGVRREVVAGRRTVGNAVRPGWFGQDVTRNRVGGRWSGIPERCLWIGLAALRDPSLVVDIVGQMSSVGSSRERGRSSSSASNSASGATEIRLPPGRATARGSSPRDGGSGRTRAAKGAPGRRPPAASSRRAAGAARALLDVLGQAALGPERALRASREHGHRHDRREQPRHHRGLPRGRRARARAVSRKPAAINREGHDRHRVAPRCRISAPRRGRRRPRARARAAARWSCGA